MSAHAVQPVAPELTKNAPEHDATVVPVVPEQVA